jgi:hypothetical protein
MKLITIQFASSSSHFHFAVVGVIILHDSRSRKKFAFPLTARPWDIASALIAYLRCEFWSVFTHLGSAVRVEKLNGYGVTRNRADWWRLQQESKYSPQCPFLRHPRSDFPVEWQMKFHIRTKQQIKFNFFLTYCLDIAQNSAVFRQVSAMHCGYQTGIETRFSYSLFLMQNIAKNTQECRNKLEIPVILLYALLSPVVTRNVFV